MKNKNRIWGYLFLALFLLVPLRALISFCFGYTVEFVNVSVLAMSIAMVSVVLCVLSSTAKVVYENGAWGMIFAAFVPLSIVNSALFMQESGKIWIVVSVFITIGCSAYLMIKYGKPRLLKTISCVISAILILPVGFLGFVNGVMVQNTVVQSIQSPNGAYYAEVIDNNQGALGGNTFVDVYEKPEIDLLIFKVCKNPQRIYRGEWGEFENMDIYWKNDDCLVIKLVEHQMEFSVAN